MIASSVSMSGLAVPGPQLLAPHFARRELGAARLRDAGRAQVAGRDVLVAVGEHRDRRRRDHLAR